MEANLNKTISWNSIFIITSFVLLILSAVSIKAHAFALTNEQYDSIKSGEIYYKSANDTVVKAFGLKTKVTMNITGVVNRVKVEQTFKNNDNFWTEGIYLFPLPEAAAVDRLKMKIGETIIEGEIKEKQEAKKTYEKAKKEGKKATLIEQQRPNLFTAKVANIPPKGEITVIIEYQQKVNYDNKVYSIKFPMVAGERYIPSSKEDNFIKEKDKNIIATVEDSGNPVDRPVQIDINLDAGFEVDKINSTYHKIKVKKQEQGYKISLDKDVQANNEFELTWKAKKKNEVQVKLFTQKSKTREFGLLMLTPEDKLFKHKDGQKKKREVIFIIDSSGSMGGTSMSQAKKALKLAVKRLNIDDRFNIIDYDSNFTALFDTAKNVSINNLKEANRFIDSLVADGGTEALPPIRFALSSKDEKSKEYLRQIIFITDGDLSNESEIFKEVKHNAGDSKFFTVSIGSAPNNFLMKRLAIFGKGTFTHIGSEQEVTKKMSELFRKIENPSLTDIKIDGIDLKISDLYMGESIYYSFEEKNIPDTLKLTANSSNGIYEKTIKTQIKKEGTGLDVLWARNTISDMMNIYYISYNASKKEQLKQMVTKLGLEYSLVTDFTSLVAVDKTPVRIKNQILKSKKVETKIPKGWKMYDAKIPQTATNSTLYLLVGIFMIFISLVFFKFQGKGYER